MITQCCYLDKYDWLVKVFYEVCREDADVILEELDAIDCEPDAFYALATMLEGDQYNQGFTYTDDELHITFIIIGKTTCASEFRNTFDHEKGHAVVHISRYFGIDPYGEEIQYLSQDLGEQMFKVAEQFMCDRCRLNFYNYGKVKVKLL